MNSSVVSRRLQTPPAHCTLSGSTAPCACNLALTRLNVHKEGHTIKVEFLESVCNDEENRRRSDEGWIQKGYTCKQLQSDEIIYKDVYDRDIEVNIRYKSACELRCINPNCVRREIKTLQFL